MARPGGLASIPPCPSLAAGQAAARARPAPSPVAFDPSSEADRIVLDSYAPAGVIVDADLQIRRFRGRTGPYLEPGPGRVSFDLLRMAREGLAGELSSALREAKKGEAAVHRKGIRILRDDRVVAVGFDVIPMHSPTGEPSFLVLFQDMPQADKEAPGTEADRSAQDRRRPVSADRGVGAGAGRDEGVRPSRPRGQGIGERRAPLGQRGTAVYERGVAERQRGAGDSLGGSAVRQRGAADAERRAARSERPTRQAQRGADGQERRSCKKSMPRSTVARSNSEAPETTRLRSSTPCGSPS